MTALVVLPPAPALLDTLESVALGKVHRIEPVPGPDESLAARVCLGINAADPPSPLVVVAAESAARLLPAVARAQHSAHRRVNAYLLVDPDLPAVSDTWPDAPVAVLSGDDWIATQVRLRGWELLEEEHLGDWLVNAMAAT